MLGCSMHIGPVGPVRSLSVGPVGTELLGQGPNGLAGVVISLELPLDLLDGVHDRRVVALAERLADGRKALLRLRAREVHGDLTRDGDTIGAAGGEQLV